MVTGNSVTGLRIRAGINSHAAVVWHYKALVVSYTHSAGVLVDPVNESPRFERTGVNLWKPANSVFGYQGDSWITRIRRVQFTA